MGVVYHGNYLAYFEDGRTELLRAQGSTYRAVEEAGTLLVVVESGVRHLRPAHYDDLLTLETRLVAARGVRLRFEYDLRRGETSLATGFTVLAVTDRDGRPRRITPEVQAMLGLAGGSEGPAASKATSPDAGEQP